MPLVFKLIWEHRFCDRIVRSLRIGEPISFLLHYLSFCDDCVPKENSTACKKTDAIVLQRLIVCVSGAKSGIQQILSEPLAMGGIMFDYVLPHIRDMSSDLALFKMLSPP